MIISLRNIRIFTVNQTNHITAGILRGNIIKRAAGNLTADALNAVAIHLEKRREATGQEREVIEFPESGAQLIWERKLPPAAKPLPSTDEIVERVLEKLQGTRSIWKAPPSEPDEEGDEDRLPIQLSPAASETAITLSNEQYERLLAKVVKTVERFMSNEVGGREEA